MVIMPLPDINLGDLHYFGVHTSIGISGFLQMIADAFFPDAIVVNDEYFNLVGFHFNTLGS